MTVSKELLVARLKYLIELTDVPGRPGVDPRLGEKVKGMIYNDEISTYLAVESVFNYLKDKADPNDEPSMDKYAREIVDFIN